ncbi:MAG: outer membrane protein assembly factor BamA [Candidatus Omnitrophica bacterium]|nr:outer membrane protein assembly factor BamA [Candidatus Omnitrophota bacterium]MCM8802746.1 outer membrane protein assembly factor BamA [Candidatus Omnitrophota bacterium]
MKIKKSLLVFLILNLYLFSTPVLKVSIIGNKNVSVDKILTIIKTKGGIEFDENVLKDDITNLIKTGYFKSVDYKIEQMENGIGIIIQVKENPVIEKIIFQGNRALKTKKLKDIFTLKEGEILNEEKIIEGIEKIKENYYKLGYYASEIDYLIEGEESCILKINIIEEGKKYVIEILFNGNKTFPEKRLKGLMKLKERKMPFRRGTYKKDVLDDDIKKIKDFYNENGFIEVKVEKEVKYSEKGIIINVFIDEGKRYFTGEIEFTGDLIFDQEILEKQILLKRGDVFNVKKNQETIKNIYKLYAGEGYIKCNVDFIPEIRGDSINITYSINPGSIYYTEEVKIKGNRITKDKVIRREIKLEPGDKIIEDKIRKSFNNLRDTNYFENVSIYPEFLEEGKANIVVDVKERERTGYFLIGGGYSSSEKFVGMVSIHQINFDIANPPRFTGGGQNISLSFEIGTITKNYKFSFTEPYFLDRPVYLGPDIYRYELNWYDWDTTSTGFDLRIGRRWENFNLGFKLMSENVILSNVEIPSLKGQEGKRRKNGITTYLIYSNLDSEMFPTKGDKVRFSLEYAGLGGDLNFLKPTIENNFYYPFKNFIFHSRTLLGYINKNLDEIPVYERFFGGGIGTVRGYEERSLGPKEDGHCLGGKFIFAQNFEMMYPLYKDVLYGIGFFDIGNVYQDWSLSNLKKSIGAGIKLNVPFFGAPLEIYYGYALDAEPGEPKGRVHIGMSFGF